MSRIIIPNQKDKTLPSLSKATISDAEAKKLKQHSGLDKVKIDDAKSVLNKNPYDGKSGLQLNYTRDKPVAQSLLNTPVYSDLSLEVCSYIDPTTNKPVDLEGEGGIYMNLQTVIITVSQAIKVVKTEIQGRNGTVKEYIGADDAHITINGIITGSNGVYPYSDVKKLKTWLDAPIAKGVTALWLQNLGIHSVVVENYSIPQVQGGYSYQMFTIGCISDLPVELKITQKNL